MQASPFPRFPARCPCWDSLGVKPLHPALSLEQEFKLIETERLLPFPHYVCSHPPPPESSRLLRFKTSGDVPAPVTSQLRGKASLTPPTRPTQQGGHPIILLFGFILPPPTSGFICAYSSPPAQLAEGLRELSIVHRCPQCQASGSIC